MNKPKKRFQGSEQTCRECGVCKPVSEFEWQKKRPAPRKICKACRYPMRDRDSEKARHRAYMKEQRKTNPGRLRRNWERATYGVCKEDLGLPFCAICGGVQRLSIDHCHNTGRVRGLLCSPCNLGLGSFRDDPMLLKRAAHYLAATIPRRGKRR